MRDMMREYLGDLAAPIRSLAILTAWVSALWLILRLLQLAFSGA